MKTITACAAVFILLSCIPHAARAQRRTSTTDGELRELREEIRQFREEQEAMRRDVQEIKRLLQQAMAGPPAPALPEFVSVDDDPSQGSADARVVLIDFSDYQ